MKIPAGAPPQEHQNQNVLVLFMNSRSPYDRTLVCPTCGARDTARHGSACLVQQVSAFSLGNGMKTSTALAVCCACWTVNGSSSFLITSGAAPSSPQHHRRPAARDRYSSGTCGNNRRQGCSARRHRLSATVMAETQPGSSSSSSSAWLRKTVSAAAAVSILVGVSVTAPVEEAAAKAPKQEPLVEALVQLPDEEVDWTK